MGLNRMRMLCLLVGLIVLGVVLIVFMRSRTYDAVVIFEADGSVAFQGKITMSAGPDGRLRPQLWVPHRVVYLSRYEHTLPQGTIKAGEVYVLDSEHKLQKISNFDPSISNGDLLARYGIQAK